MNETTSRHKPLIPESTPFRGSVLPSAFRKAGSLDLLRESEVGVRECES
jgi:hypothetical protein